MRWVHYSKDPFVGPVLNSKQRAIGMKPVGLWITPDDGSGEYTWANFCRDADFEVDGLLTSCEVVLYGEGRILTLESTKELIEFSHQYRAKHQSFDGFVYSLNWEEVARNYGGILIPRHHWGVRLEPDTAWYSSWSCASGCIWDSSAIQSVRPVGSSRAARPTLNLGLPSK